ncbi:uncharacterized protein L201_001567 [Kwoniella dendrophila CBS 6074]|uniref:Uncharacterized protein n=1 Tax=Kwoniella dendrophila CBS 6074 TaxID=1295534 RepID=A0AAX4JQ80_9TREE
MPPLRPTQSQGRAYCTRSKTNPTPIDYDENSRRRRQKAMNSDTKALFPDVKEVAKYDARLKRPSRNRSTVEVSQAPSVKRRSKRITLQENDANLEAQKIDINKRKRVASTAQQTVTRLSKAKNAKCVKKRRVIHDSESENMSEASSKDVSISDNSSTSYDSSSLSWRPLGWQQKKFPAIRQGKSAKHEIDSSSTSSSNSAVYRKTPGKAKTFIIVTAEDEPEEEKEDTLSQNESDDFPSLTASNFAQMDKIERFNNDLRRFRWTDGGSELSCLSEHDLEEDSTLADFEDNVSQQCEIGSYSDFHDAQKEERTLYQEDNAHDDWVRDQIDLNEVGNVPFNASKYQSSSSSQLWSPSKNVEPFQVEDAYEIRDLAGTPEPYHPFGEDEDEVDKGKISTQIGSNDDTEDKQRFKSTKQDDETQVEEESSQKECPEGKAPNPKKVDEEICDTDMHIAKEDCLHYERSKMREGDFDIPLDAFLRSELQQSAKPDEDLTSIPDDATKLPPKDIHESMDPAHTPRQSTPIPSKQVLQTINRTHPERAIKLLEEDSGRRGHRLLTTVRRSSSDVPANAMYSGDEKVTEADEAVKPTTNQDNLNNQSKSKANPLITLTSPGGSTSAVILNGQEKNTKTSIIPIPSSNTLEKPKYKYWRPPCRSVAFPSTSTTPQSTPVSPHPQNREQPILTKRQSNGLTLLSNVANTNNPLTETEFHKDKSTFKYWSTVLNLDKETPKLDILTKVSENINDLPKFGFNLKNGQPRKNPPSILKTKKTKAKQIDFSSSSDDDDDNDGIKGSNSSGYTQGPINHNSHNKSQTYTQPQSQPFLPQRRQGSVRFAPYNRFATVPTSYDQPIIRFPLSNTRNTPLRPWI